MNKFFPRAKQIGIRHIKDWLPFGELRGREWFALNPTRQDKEIGSFSVNLDTGAFLDRINNGDKGGDAIALYAFINNIKQGEAALKILEDYDSEYFPDKYNESDYKPKVTEWKCLEDGTGNPPKLDTEWYQAPDKWGKEVERWKFENSRSNIIMVVVRFVKDNKKSDRPFTLWSNGRETKWKSKALPNKYPLWNCNELEERQNDAVLLCEGQKSASRAKQKIGDKYICVAWYGGAQATNKTDFDPLVNRFVFFWPDADAPGRTVIKKLEKYNMNLHIINIPREVPKGWDIADAIEQGWTKQKLIDLIETSKPLIIKKDIKEYNKIYIENNDGVKDILEQMNEMNPGDSFNAWLVMQEIKKDFLYDCEKKAWFRYNKIKNYWEKDIENNIIDIAKNKLLELYFQAAIIPETGMRDQWTSWARKSDNVYRISAAIQLCQCMPGLVVRNNIWNRNTDLLNCKNGTLNVKTFKFQDKNKNDYLTQQTNAEYDPDAKSEIWTKFISEIFDEETSKYFQKVVGLCLTADVSEQKFWCCFGIGSNGKSVAINTIINMLGDYAVEIDIDILMEAKYEKTEEAKPGLMRIINKRLVAASENKRNQSFNQGLLKKLTGDDDISARLLRENIIEFSPICKVLIKTNHKPKVPSGGHSFWRRLKLIPFQFVISDDRQDKHLKQKLKKEYSGILNWMIAGLKMYKKEGLLDTESVRVSSKQYEDSQDILKEFLATAKKENLTQRQLGELYSEYREWANTNGEWKMSKRAFKQTLNERGYEKSEFGGAIYYKIDEAAEAAKPEDIIPF